MKKEKKSKKKKKKKKKHRHDTEELIDSSWLEATIPEQENRKRKHSPSYSDFTENKTEPTENNIECHIPKKKKKKYRKEKYADVTIPSDRNEEDDSDHGKSKEKKRKKKHKKKHKHETTVDTDDEKNYRFSNDDSVPLLDIKTFSRHNPMLDKRQDKFENDTSSSEPHRRHSDHTIRYISQDRPIKESHVHKKTSKDWKNYPADKYNIVHKSDIEINHKSSRETSPSRKHLKTYMPRETASNHYFGDTKLKKSSTSSSRDISRLDQNLNKTSSHECDNARRHSRSSSWNSSREHSPVHTKSYNATGDSSRDSKHSRSNSRDHSPEWKHHMPEKVRLPEEKYRKSTEKQYKKGKQKISSDLYSNRDSSDDENQKMHLKKKKGII